jgi:hypothetical protein
MVMIAGRPADAQSDPHIMRAAENAKPSPDLPMPHLVVGHRLLGGIQHFLVWIGLAGSFLGRERKACAQQRGGGNQEVEDLLARSSLRLLPRLATRGMTEVSSKESDGRRIWAA